MQLMVNEEQLAYQLIEERRASGGDHHDEVWDGVYMMPPLPNNEHQALIAELTMILYREIDFRGLRRTLPGANVSDQQQDWTKNFRCPDVLVFLKGCTAEDRNTHRFGGPDFAVELVSRGDRTLDKLELYAKVKTRERQVIDRNPWKLTLYKNDTEKTM